MKNTLLLLFLVISTGLSAQSGWYIKSTEFVRWEYTSNLDVTTEIDKMVWGWNGSGAP